VISAIRVTRRALESALQGARESHPNEFVALLDGSRGSQGVRLDSLVIPPLAHGDPFSSGFQPWFLPASSGGLASFHSHPSRSNKPSRQDLDFFSRTRRWHFIARYPYRAEDVAAYDAEGAPVGFTIV
jgi:proteasome lid subunit RPN8/RPN11